MLKITEILRLNANGLKQRQIARSLNLSIGAVHKYLNLARAAGVKWPLAQDIDEKQLKEQLFKASQACASKTHVMPDCQSLHKELKHKGVTLRLLHEEYKQMHPDAYYHYSQFCNIYRQWKKKQQISLRQVHKAGESLFIDYAGPSVAIIDETTGQSLQAHLFIAVLGASNYTYVEATSDQSLPNWLGSHARAFSFFGGVPELLVPDNLKSGVSQADKYDPDINPSYTEMAAYYDTAIMPARPYKPKDKAKVENTVLIVERWILAKLRHTRFASLLELNQAIKVLLEELNNKPFQKIPGSRYSQFQELDKPALKPLPARPYEYAVFKRRLVGADYHIEIDKHFYSVPYQYVRNEVDARLTAHTVEIFQQGQRIASHVRSSKPGNTTLLAHMPEAHRQHCLWTPESCLRWAESLGQSTHALMHSLSKKKAHPQQLYRSFLGFLRLVKCFGGERVEAACKRANFYKYYSYKKVKAILEKGLDYEALPPLLEQELPPIEHGNIRGSNYYQ